jgi:type III secretory pathway component EscT
MAFLLGLGCILMIFIEISLKFEFNRWTMFYKKIRLFILILALVLLAELNFGCMSRMSEDDNVLYYYVAGSFQIGGSLTFVIASTLLTYNIFKEMSLKNDLQNEYLLN